MRVELCTSRLNPPTIDTTQFSDELDGCSAEEITEFFKHHNLTTGQTALYCGSLTKPKDIDFLLKSALIIKNKITNFSLLIIGNGPEKELVKTYAENYLWIIYLGSLYRREKHSHLSAQIVS